VNKELGEKFQHTSPQQTTTLEKIILNSGVGQAVNNKQLLDNTVQALHQITGQKPVITHAKKSITNFKLREGMPIGCKIANNQGLSQKKFDRRGNYSFGINKLSIFPAVNYDLTFKNQGLQIALVFSSSSFEENTQFLNCLGFPFTLK
ncbi:11033_t:CDS:2, partial [Racocetra persica]